MRKGVYEMSGLMFLMIFLLVLIINIWSFGITGEVIIDFETDFSYCDFNVSCSFTNWSSGNTYCLNESQVVSGTCFNITNDSVTLDLQGFNITGDGSGGGVYVSQHDNVWLTNGGIVNFDIGIAIADSSDSSIGTMIFFDNNVGILVLRSDAGNFSNILSSDNVASGMYFNESSDNLIEDVVLSNNWRYGIELHSSNSNSFSNSVASGNSFNGVYISNSDSNSFIDFIFNGSVDGIYVYDSDNNFFLNVISHDNTMSGINIEDSDGNFFNDVVSHDNDRYGVGIDDSVNNVFLDASFFDNDLAGIDSDSSQNIFHNLSLSGNGANSTIGIDTISYNVSVDKKIEWNLNSNFTLSGGLDFGSNVEFGNNYIDVNSSGLPSNFNSSATVTLDLGGSGITDPVLFVDGVLCDDDVCEILSFNNDVAVFTVTHFTNYSFSQATCGDAYCSSSEDCSICAGDCGECPVFDAPQNDDNVSVNDTVSVADDTATTTTTTNNDSDDTPDADLDEAAEIPWLWIFIGIGVIVLGVIIFVVVLMIVKRGGGGVITVTRPDDSSFGAEVGNVGAAVSAPVAGAPVPVKAVNPPKKKVVVKKAPIVVKKPVEKVVPVEKKVVEHPVVPLSPTMRYIKYYAQNVSHNPKGRIDYLMEKGKGFVGVKDFVSAKQIYVLIFKEYKGLEMHDEELFQRIVNFRKSIVG